MSCEENVKPTNVVRPAVTELVKNGSDHKEKNKPKQSKQPTEWKIQNFTIGPVLGKGKFGVAYLAQERVTKDKRMVVLKVMFKSHLETSGVKEPLRREIETHSRLRHPNVIRMYGAFTDAKRVYVVLEHAEGGELYKYLQSQPNQCLSEPHAARWIGQIIRAVRFCHKNGIIHRDIKPENILITKDNDLKLADFGWCVQSPEGFIDEKNRRTTLCGTMDYLPPEMLEQRVYGKAVDVWTVGVLAYEFLAGSTPFVSAVENETYERIMNVELDFPNHISPLAQDFISKLLRKNPEERMTLREAFHHEWILRHLNPKQRREAGLAPRAEGEAEPQVRLSEESTASCSTTASASSAHRVSSLTPSDVPSCDGDAANLTTVDGDC